MRSKTMLLTQLVLVVGLLAPSLARAQTKVAVVDHARVMSACVAGQRVEADLRQRFAARQAEIEAMRDQIEKEKEALEKEQQAGKTPRDALQKKNEALVRRFGTMQSLAAQHEQDLERRRVTLIGPVEREAKAVLAELAKAGGFTLVVDRSAVRFAEGEIDLTDKAIAAVNAKLK